MNILLAICLTNQPLYGMMLSYFVYIILIFTPQCVFYAMSS